MLRETFHKYKWSLYMKFSRGLVQCTCFMTSIFVCKLFFISKIWFLKRYYNKNYLINWKNPSVWLILSLVYRQLTGSYFHSYGLEMEEAPGWLSQWKETQATYWNGRRGESLTMFFQVSIYFSIKPPLL
jgi:hypothetical protein